MMGVQLLIPQVRLVRIVPESGWSFLFSSCVHVRPTVGFHMLIKPIFILSSTVSFLGTCATFRRVGEGAVEWFLKCVMKKVVASL